mmetsp:Transcript_6187/g.15360  ORF Transcript_6187/g.15360 Transcript_6187/m.15360 type:complete len:105 (-) Transcript_6187:2057-2371(-)
MHFVATGLVVRCDGGPCGAGLGRSQLDNATLGVGKRTSLRVVASASRDPEVQQVPESKLGVRSINNEIRTVHSWQLKCIYVPLMKQHYSLRRFRLEYCDDSKPI